MLICRIIESLSAPLIFGRERLLTIGTYPYKQAVLRLINILHSVMLADNFYAKSKPLLRLAPELKGFESGSICMTRNGNPADDKVVWW